MNAENENKGDSLESAGSGGARSEGENASSEVGNASTEVKDADATLKLERTSEAAAAEVAPASGQSAGSGGRREDRKNWIDNVNKTCEYIGQISNDKSLHFRSSDKLTSRLLIGAFLLSLCFAALPFWNMNAVAAFAYLLADVLLFVSISIFVVSRFGIIRAMEARHALVCWHLMVGTGLLALVVGFNLVAAVVIIMMRDRVQLLFPGG